MFKRFSKDESGASAVEFAIIAMPLFLTIFANIELGLKSVQQSELDSKMNSVASLLGKNADPSGSAIEFVNGTLCQEIGTVMLNCNKITVGAKVIPQSSRMINFQNTSIIGEWDIGCTGDTVMIEMNYPVANMTHPIVIGDIVERGDSNFYRSRAVIRREPVLTAKGGASC